MSTADAQPQVDHVEIAYYNLGDAYVELNRVEEARAAYETFLALQPNAKAAPQAREKLRSLAAR